MDLVVSLMIVFLGSIAWDVHCMRQDIREFIDDMYESDEWEEFDG